MRVGEEVAGMPRARPQAVRKVAVREVRVSLRKSRRERLFFLMVLITVAQEQRRNKCHLSFFDNINERL